MARTRNLKPGFLTNEVLAECDPLARLFFAGLWCHADREGRLEWRPKRLKAEILPYDDCDVSAFAQQLEERGFILRYEHDGITYLQVVNFGKHQNPHVKEAASTIPAPGEHQASTVQAGPSTSNLKPSTSSSSEANASAAVAALPPEEPIPLDTKAAIFGEQLDWLKENTGRTEGQLRAWLGKCCGQYGEVQVLAAILNIRAGPSPVDPISRMRSILERQASRNGRPADKKLSPVESLYAGAALALAERERSLNRGTGHDPAEPLLDGSGRAGNSQAATG